jgi:hypothetical protein
MLKCSAVNCKETVVGGKRELKQERFLDGTSKTEIKPPLFYCQQHEAEAERHFDGKKFQALTKEQLDYWATK